MDTQLPVLSLKSMKKLEASITTRINKWFPSMIKTSSPYEVKHTRGSLRFAMRELKEHQRDWLLACASPTGCTFKIPDTSYSASPFDCFHFKNATSYVIIVFPTWIVAIDIKVLMLIKETSITEEKARRISAFSIQTKDV